MNINITRYHTEHIEELDKISYEYDTQSLTRPAWLHVTNTGFNASFITVATNNISSILYKRFTGNFYYPYDMSKEEELKFYNKYAEYYDKFTLKNNLPMAKFLLQKMNELNISLEAAILDLGSGTGICSNLATEKGYKNITLMDRSAGMINVARNKPALTNMTFIEGDITEVTLNEKYDAIVSVMMFDAIGDAKLDDVLKKTSESLNTNGYILLIEDKDRESFSKYFETIEKGFFEISKEKNFSKWYFIGKKK